MTVDVHAHRGQQRVDPNSALLGKTVAFATEGKRAIISTPRLSTEMARLIGNGAAHLDARAAGAVQS
jgi:hypothetical protein